MWQADQERAMPKVFHPHQRKARAMSEPLTVDQRAAALAEELWHYVDATPYGFTDIIARHLREAIADAIHREGHYWTCPSCGGHYFGRPTVEVNGVKQIDMTRIRCHGASSEGDFYCGKVYPDMKREASDE
jgi:hypothetical protein